MNTFPGSIEQWVRTRWFDSLNTLHQLGYSWAVARVMTGQAMFGTGLGINAVTATNWGRNEKNYNWMASVEAFPAIETDETTGQPIFTSLHLASQRLWTAWQMAHKPSGPNGDYNLDPALWDRFSLYLPADEAHHFVSAWNSENRDGTTGGSSTTTTTGGSSTTTTTGGSSTHTPTSHPLPTGGAADDGSQDTSAEDAAYDSAGSGRSKAPLIFLGLLLLGAMGAKGGKK